MRFVPLLAAKDGSKLQFMMQRRVTTSGFRVVASGLLIFAVAPFNSLAEPTSSALSAYDRYINVFESRLAQQHRSLTTFLVTPGSATQERLRQGEFIVEPITPPAGSDFPGALMHHWRGTAFAAGAKASDFERVMSDFDAYPKNFKPQVIQAKVLTRQDDHFSASMRVRQKHVITVVLDTTYDITFERLDAKHGYSITRSGKISEVGSPGTAAEHVLSSSEEHGFLWRQNTYWSYEERDGGLYMQIESISLTRSIPNGLSWAVQPFVEKIPRESLEFTLRSTCNALRR
jgi:hypothetical protein